MTKQQIHIQRAASLLILMAKMRAQTISRASA